MLVVVMTMLMRMVNANKDVIKVSEEKNKRKI